MHKLAERAPLGRDGNGRTRRTTAVLVGVLFLTSTVTFAVGSSLVASFFSGDSPAASTLLAGVLLEVYTGLAVAGIGLAMLPLLRRLERPAGAPPTSGCGALEPAWRSSAYGGYLLATTPGGVNEVRPVDLLVHGRGRDRLLVPAPGCPS